MESYNLVMAVFWAIASIGAFFTFRSKRFRWAVLIGGWMLVISHLARLFIP